MEILNLPKHLATITVLSIHLNLKAAVYNINFISLELSILLELKQGFFLNLKMLPRKRQNVSSLLFIFYLYLTSLKVT